MVSRFCYSWWAHMESGFCHSWWDTHGVQISSFRFLLWSPQFGKGLVHLVFSPCLVVRLLVVRPTWSGETGSPPLKISGFFFMNRGFFGGRGIARPPSSSHLRCVLPLCLRSSEEEGLAPLPPPHIVEEFSGGGGTGPPPHKSGEYFGGGGTGLLPHIDGTYDDYSLVAQCRMIVSKIELGR